VTDSKKRTDRDDYTTKTPGVFVYPWLLKADTKFDKGGVFKVTVQFPEDSKEAPFMVKHIDKLCSEELARQRAGAKTKAAAKRIKLCENMPYSESLDPDTEEELGGLQFNFKMKASGKNKTTGEAWSRKPAVFDSAGVPVPASIQIGSGTTGYVAFEYSVFYTSLLGVGVSLRLRGVQICDLVEWTGGGAEGFGFGTGGEGLDPKSSEEVDTSDDAEDDPSPEDDPTEADAADAFDPEDF